MANLGRLRREITDTAGNSLASVDVDVRKQGASVDGAQAVSSGGTVTVKSVGAVTAATGSVRVFRGDPAIEVDVGPGLGTTFAVSAVAETTIQLTWGGAGANFNDEDRLLYDQQASIFEDAIGQDAAANPIETSVSGVAGAWAKGNYYDLFVSGGAIVTPFIVQDTSFYAEAVESNILQASGESAFDLDTVRTLSATGKIRRWLHAGVEKASIDKDGDLTTLGAIAATGDIASSAGDLISTAGDLILGAAAAKIIPGSTSLSLRDSTDTFDNLLVEENGDVTIRGDLTVGGGQHRGYLGPFMRADIEGTGTIFLDLSVGGQNEFTELVATRAGSVTGISVALSAPRTAGTADVEIYINGVATGLNATLDGTNVQYHQATQDAGLDEFVVGDRISVRLVTTGFTPAATEGLVSSVEIITV